MCKNECEENCFCQVKERPCDPFHCKCKPEKCKNPVKRAKTTTTTTSETCAIEEEVKVKLLCMVTVM